MKIVLVSPFSEEANQIAGGVAAVSQYLAEALIEIGHDVSIIAPGKSFAQRETRGSLQIIWAGIPKLPGFLVYANQQRKQIFSLLDEIRPDVVHFEGSFGWSIHCSYPYVVTIHGIAEKDAAFGGNFLKCFIASRVIKISENKGRKIAKQVISISPYATELLKEYLKGDIHHIDNPIDDALFAYPSSATKRQDKLVCAGVVGERKNTLGVINSFAKLKQFYPAAKLTVCGVASNENYLQECRKLTSDLGLNDAVVFTGNLSREKLYKELSSATALIMMSKQETAPMAIAEAMALGLPCIAPSEFGIPYMIEEKVNGWFISETTADEKWQEIATSLQGENWQKLSEDAQKSALRFHPQHVAKATVTVYDLAIKGH
ncbi:MAG: glycosyltransferase involved in cell wall biosynthesis [Gammaproteobacteria bacterium]|jgi:glycosyltransferase involved in cell wall biosynthesis